MAICCIDDVGLNLKVLKDEVGRLRTIRQNPSHLCSRENHTVQRVTRDEFIYGYLIAQVELCVSLER